MDEQFSLSKSNDVKLHILQVEDAERLFSLTNKNRKYLREWLPWVDATKTSEDSKQFIQSSLEQYAKGTGIQFGIWFQEDIAGAIGLHYININNRKTSIGYWLGQDYQGKGIMTTACTLLIEYCFNKLHLNRVEISCAVGNSKSCAIPQRLGFTNEGIIRESEWLYDHFVDHEFYGLLAKEWMINK